MNSCNLGYLYSLQLQNQKEMLAAGLYDSFKMQSTKTVPVDDIRLVSYHVQQLMSEIGEVLEADKRWKNFRNETYNKENKKEEIADCFIVMMNIAMYSGITEKELIKIIETKILKVQDRVGLARDK